MVDVSFTTYIYFGVCVVVYGCVCVPVVVYVDGCADVIAAVCVCLGALC